MGKEPDALPQFRILLVSGVTVVVLVLCALVAVVWVRATGGGPAHTEPGIEDIPVRIGPIEARMYAGPRVEVLSSDYGWFDRERGEVRVPVDEAIRWVSEGMRPPGAPPAEAP